MSRLPSIFLIFSILIRINVSQTICISGVYTRSGFLNGNYIRINDHSGFPAYWQDLTGSDNAGCGVSNAYIYSM